MIPDYR